MAISSLISKFRQLQTIDTQLQSIKSYFLRHSDNVNTMLVDLATDLESGEAKAHHLGLDVVLPIAYDDANEIHLGVLARTLYSGVEAVLTREKSDPSDITCTVYKSDGTQMNMSLDEIIQRLRDNYGYMLSLTNTVESMLNTAYGRVTDFMSDISRRLSDADVPDQVRSVVLHNLSSVCDTNPSLSSSNILQYSESFLHAFGVSNQGEIEPIPNATYTGANPISAVLSDAWDGVQSFFSTAHDVFLNVCGATLYAIVKGFEFIAENYTYAAARLYNFITNRTGAVSCSGDGDGSIAVDYTYSLSGSWQGQYIDNALETMGNDSCTVLLPFGTFIAQKVMNGQSSVDYVRFIPKVLNHVAVRQVLIQTIGYGSSMLPWHSQDGMLCITNSSGVPHGPAITLNDVNDMFDALQLKRDEILSVPDWYNDADRLEGIYWSQFLSTLLVKLFAWAHENEASDWNVTQTFSDLSEPITNGLFANWAAINEEAGNFKPANYHFGVLACSMTRLTTAWAHGVNGVIPATNSSSFNDMEPSLDRCPMLNAFATYMRLTWYQKSVKAGTSLFLPYQCPACYVRPSWYILTDEQNKERAAGVLKRGAITLAIATAVVVAAICFTKLRSKYFELGAQAGAWSWKAAETGDPALMKKAYAIQKRTNFLGRLLGVSPSVSNSVDYNSTLNSIGKLIDPNF
jgi:hypothetical protein